MTLLIVGAMDIEIDVIKKHLVVNDDYREENVNGFVFYFGHLYNKNIILVKSGVGRVNSALLIAMAKMKYDFDYCINIGLAGGMPGLNKKDIVIGERTVYGDVNIAVFECKYVYGQMSCCPAYYKADETLLNTIKNNDELVKDVKFGSICTCEQFTVDINKTNKLIEDHFKDMNILAFDMESAAYAQSCYRLNIPFLAIRFISDIIGSDGQAENYIEEEVELARETRTNEYVVKLIEKL